MQALLQALGAGRLAGILGRRVRHVLSDAIQRCPRAGETAGGVAQEVLAP